MIYKPCRLRLYDNRVLAASAMLALVLTPAAADEGINYSYDALGRLTAVAHSGSANNGINSQYCYDDAGNRAKQVVNSTGIGLCVRVPKPAGRVLKKSDFNGDGRDDIVWRKNNGPFSNWLSTAVGGFIVNDAEALVGIPVDYQIAGTGDLNGDGFSDIVLRNLTNGNIFSWVGRPSGGFGSYLGREPPAGFMESLSLDWKVAGVGDFNGDGISDLLLRNDNGLVAQWQFQRDGLWHNNASFGVQVDVDWRVILVADMNGDGRADIIWRRSNGDMAEWLGQPNGAFADNGLIAAPFTTDWNVAGSGDFNGDGISDLLFRNNNGAVASWLFQPDGLWHNNNNVGYMVGTDWRIVGVGDYNGDGRSDILWRNASGVLSDWLANSNGSFTSNDANAMSNVDNAWYIGVMPAAVLPAAPSAGGQPGAGAPPPPPPPPPPPVANSDEALVGVCANTNINVLANDTDPQGKPISMVGIVKHEGVGSSTLQGSLIRFRSNGQTGGVTITYRIANSDGTTAIGYLTVIVNDDGGCN